MDRTNISSKPHHPGYSNKRLTQAPEWSSTDKILCECTRALKLDIIVLLTKGCLQIAQTIDRAASFPLA